MVLLELLGIGFTIACISKYGEKQSKRAYPQMQDKKVQSSTDAEFARYGIKGKNNKFTDTKINMIAARCNVTPNKYGVLPENGWKHCRSYVARYANSNQDILDFEQAWYTTVQHQLKMQRSEISNPNKNKKAKAYNDVEQYIKHSLKSRKNGPTIVLEYRHWHGISKDEQLKRMKELQQKTIWGKICKEAPLLRDNPYAPNSYTEIWIINGKPDDEQGSSKTNREYKKLYEKCCAKIGYNAHL